MIRRYTCFVIGLFELEVRQLNCCSVTTRAMLAQAFCVDECQIGDVVQCLEFNTAVDVADKMLKRLLNWH